MSGVVIEVFPYEGGSKLEVLSVVKHLIIVQIACV